MSHSYYHALSSAEQFGGEAGDYLAIHDWFDEFKNAMPDLRHRAIRHHSQGIHECERVFGAILVNSADKTVPVRLVGEQHVMEDLGKIPTMQDWLTELPMKSWMAKSKKLSEKFNE